MNNETLGTALTKEVARVRDLIPIYLSVPMGHIAAALMKHDLDKAAKAMMEGDVIAMLQVYESLKGFK
jgi:hypothetical protein